MNTLYIDNTITDEGTTWNITARNSGGMGTEFLNDYGKGVLAHNPKLDLYIGKYTDPVRPLAYLPSEPIIYRATIHDASKTIFWLLPRNASTSVLASLYYTDASHGEENVLWENHTITLEEYETKKEDYAGYKHVAVVQDPISRFVGWMEFLMATRAEDDYLKDSIPELKRAMFPGVEANVWQLCTLARLVNTNPTFDTAPQLLSQSNFISKLPPLDVLVPIAILDYYLQSEMGVLPVHRAMNNAPVFWLGQINRSHALEFELLDIYKEDLKLADDKRLWNPGY